MSITISNVVDITSMELQASEHNLSLFNIQLRINYQRDQHNSSFTGCTSGIITHKLADYNNVTLFSGDGSYSYDS